MMRASQIDPTKLAYKTLYGPYDWNRYPLAPLGCKAVLYKDDNTRGLWASRGVDGWYLGPSMDHYHCNIYYIPKTHAYHISGSTKLFPQHCQLPDMTPHQHLRALTNELTDLALPTNEMPKGNQLLQLLQTCIQVLLKLPNILLEQRVDDNAIACKKEQRVINDTPILTIPCITEAPGIMQSCNPMAKHMLKNTPCLHQRVTWNNTPGIMRVPPILPKSIANHTAASHVSSNPIRSPLAHCNLPRD